MTVKFELWNQSNKAIYFGLVNENKLINQYESIEPSKVAFVRVEPDQYYREQIWLEYPTQLIYGRIERYPLFAKLYNFPRGRKIYLQVNIDGELELQRPHFSGFSLVKTVRGHSLLNACWRMPEGKMIRYERVSEPKTTSETISEYMTSAKDIMKDTWQNMTSGIQQVTGSGTGKGLPTENGTNFGLSAGTKVKIAKKVIIG